MRFYQDYLQDVGLYACGARNEMNKDGDKVDGVVYLNMDRGGCHRRYLMDGKFEMYIEN